MGLAWWSGGKACRATFPLAGSAHSVHGGKNSRKKSSTTGAGLDRFGSGGRSWERLASAEGQWSRSSGRVATCAACWGCPFGESVEKFSEKKFRHWCGTGQFWLGRSFLGAENDSGGSVEQV